VHFLGSFISSPLADAHKVSEKGEAYSQSEVFHVPVGAAKLLLHRHHCDWTSILKSAVVNDIVSLFIGEEPDRLDHCYDENAEDISVVKDARPDCEEKSKSFPSRSKKPDDSSQGPHDEHDYTVDGLGQTELCVGGRQLRCVLGCVSEPVLEVVSLYPVEGT